MNYRVFATSGVKHVKRDCHALGPKDDIFVRHVKNRPVLQWEGPNAGVLHRCFLSSVKCPSPNGQCSGSL